MSLELLQSLIGTERTSGWHLLDQARIDAFAAATDDRQFIHVDPQRAAVTPFGGTIAHGFLSLSMISAMSYELEPALPAAVVLNYGVDRLRFLTPVRAGERVRGRFVLAEITPKGQGRHLLAQDVTVEIEGRDTPALVVRSLGLLMA
jgi:acyl dehydratase